MAPWSSRWWVWGSRPWWWEGELGDITTEYLVENTGKALDKCHIRRLRLAWDGQPFTGRISTSIGQALDRWAGSADAVTNRTRSGGVESRAN